MVEKHYTVDEAATISRMSISWWRQRLFHKDIKHLKIGRRVFIPESVITDLLNKSIVEVVEK